MAIAMDMTMAIATAMAMDIALGVAIATAMAQAIARVTARATGLAMAEWSFTKCCVLRSGLLAEWSCRVVCSVAT